MKALVAIKRVVDHNIKIRVKPDGSGIDLDNVKMSMNPFDEIALEEALRLKTAEILTEVVVVTIGPDRAQDVLRSGLAMGADRAIHIVTDGAMEPLAVAKLLAAVVAEEGPRLVILGKQAIDDDANQTGQMLAALLGWPQGTFASMVEIKGSVLRVTREVDGGTQVLDLDLPAVVTADLRLNVPRYPSLPNIMKAKSKPLAQKTPADLGVDVARRTQVLRTDPAPPRKGGGKVSSVAELIDRLRNEAGVL